MARTENGSEEQTARLLSLLRHLDLAGCEASLIAEGLEGGQALSFASLGTTLYNSATELRNALSQQAEGERSGPAEEEPHRAMGTARMWGVFDEGELTEPAGPIPIALFESRDEAEGYCKIVGWETVRSTLRRCDLAGVVEPEGGMP